MAKNVNKPDICDSQLKSLIENLPIGIFRSTPHGKILSVNSKLVKIYGYSSTEEMLKISAQELYCNPKQRTKLLKLAAKDGRVENFVVEHCRKDGKRIWLSLSLNVVKNPQGNVEYYDGIAEDISEKKQAEQTLAEYEERYRAFIDEALVGVYIYSNQKNGYLFVNPAMSEITGYSIDELLNMDPSLMAIPEDRIILEKRTEAFLNGKRFPPQYTIRIKRKNGEQATLTVRTRRISFNGEQVTLGNCIDSTEQVKQREQIERAKREWERTFDATSDLVMITDKRQKIIRANIAVSKYSELEFNKLLTKSCYDVFHISKDAVEECPQKECIRTGTTQYTEITDPETAKIFSISISPFVDKNGEIIGTVNVARDITERKRMEKQLLRTSKLASIGVLAAGIAHQINNPLAIMVLIATALRNLFVSQPKLPQQLQEKIQKYLDTLDKQIERTRKVVTGLLEFTQEKRSKIEAVEVNSSINEALQFLSQPLSSENLVLQLSLFKDISPAMADPVALQQVIINVLQNAIDSMNAKGKLSVKTEQKNKRIKISIKDSGCGIPDYLRDEIFEPLFSTKSSGKGTGLGLAVSVMLLERFGGKIYIEETSSMGTTFVIEVPVAVSEKKQRHLG